MRLDRYLAKSRIIDIKSKDLKGALQELLRVSISRSSEKMDPAKLLRAILERENSMTTYLGNGVAFPHLRLKMKRPYLFAIGRCPEGIQYDGMSEYKKVRIFILMLASENEKNYLEVLASIARQFQEKSVVEHIIISPDLNTFRERVVQGMGGLLARPQRAQARFNSFLLKEAAAIAKTAGCSTLMLFAETFAGAIDLPRSIRQMKTIVVTHTPLRLRSTGTAQKKKRGEKEKVASIELRSVSQQRLSQLRSAVLIGLTRGIIESDEKLCCAGGLPGSNLLDTIVVVDVAKEFQSVLVSEKDILPKSVKVEVMERLLSIATELAVQGREDKPVGCLFVVGDSAKVSTMVKPLVLNPFYGYAEVDRNVLNPFMDETIKEFSSIDGAFIMRGDGVIVSAGTLVHAPAYYYRDMPSGLGARHSAGAAISMATDCIAIVISASTRKVTLFRNGVMLPLIQKSYDSSL